VSLPGDEACLIIKIKKEADMDLGCIRINLGAMCKDIQEYKQM
jgi:hypothetical protein